MTMASVRSMLLLLGLLSTTALAGTADHRYKPGEHVELWVNKVSFFFFGQSSLVFSPAGLLLGPPRSLWSLLLPMATSRCENNA